MFYLDSPKSTNTIIIKTGFSRSDHHLNDFAIDVLVGNTFVPISGTMVNNAGATIQGSRVNIAGQDEVRVAFDEKMDVTAVKIHAYGSDALNENSVLSAVFVLHLEDTSNFTDVNFNFEKC